jgi:hypothetical protein
MTYNNDQRSIIRLVADVIDEMTQLFQAEMRLARAEINDKVSRIASGSTLIGVGVLAAIGSVMLLLQAVVKWLAIAGLPEQWGLLIVGIIVGAAGVSVLLRGVNNLKATNLTPDRTLDQLKADLATVKEHIT